MINFHKSDADFEDFSLSEDGLFALPVSISEDADGSIELTHYALAKEISEDFVSAFGNDLFSIEARNCLINKLSPVMEKYGYFATEETGDILLEYRMTAAVTKPCTNTVILKTSEEIAHFPSDTTLWRLEVDDDDPLDVICAVIENGHIAAFAAANDFADGVCEVNVECAPQYRRRGYGSACAAGFANYILSETDAECVSYVCREKNTASQKTAIRAGFQLSGRSAAFVFYR